MHHVVINLDTKSKTIVNYHLVLTPRKLTVESI